MYTTAQKVKTLDATITMSDSDINSVIKSVTSYINKYCNQKLATDGSVAVTSLFLDGSGTESIVFPVAINGSPVAKLIGLDGSLTDETYVVFYPLNEAYKTYMMRRVGVFNSGNANYQIDGIRLGMFTYFWSDTSNALHSLPQDITDVCTRIVVNTIKAGGIQAEDNQKSGKITSETIGSYSVSYANNTDNIEKSINSTLNATNVLDNYKLYANIA